MSAMLLPLAQEALDSAHFADVRRREGGRMLGLICYERIPLVTISYHESGSYLPWEETYQTVKLI